MRDRSRLKSSRQAAERVRRRPRLPSRLGLVCADVQRASYLSTYTRLHAGKATQLPCTTVVHYFTCEQELEDVFDCIDHVHVGQRAARYPSNARTSHGIARCIDKLLVGFPAAEVITWASG